MPHGRSLQRGAPTVGALGDAAMDKKRRAMDIVFPYIMGIHSDGKNSDSQSLIIL